jgi:serine/threonine-protein kinase
MTDPQAGPDPKGSPPPPAAKPPTRVGGFEVIEKVGHGGMGAVYRARQVSLDRIVALKILPPRLEKDAEFMRRFLGEARATGKLSHQNIVSGIDVGQADGYWYFAMEFVEGESLGRILKRKGRLPEAQAVDIVLQAAEGLAHAHAHSLIHRDVKPENILIDRQGTAKVCDLGLARNTAADNPSLTQDGTTVGTPSYLSPEQARGQKDIDARADVYSLGATLFHLVAGRPPFTGETAAVVMTKHLTEPAPDLSKAAEGVSAGLAVVVARCLKKDPNERYRSMAELAEDLKRIRQGQVPATPPASSAAPSRATTSIVRAKTGLHSATRPITIRAIVRSAEARSGSPAAFITALVGLGILAVGAAAFLGLQSRNEPATRGTAPKPAPPPSSTPDPPPAPRPSDLPARLEQAERYRRDHPADMKGALVRFKDLEAAAKGTEFEDRASRAISEIAARRVESARDAEARLAAAAEALAARDDFDGAVAEWSAIPPDLADLLRPRADQAAADLRARAEARIKSAMDEASLRLSAGEPDEGLHALEAVKGVNYAAWEPRVAALRSQIVKAAGDAAGIAKNKAVVAAMKAYEKYANAFVAATVSSDYAEARKIAEDAKADPVLKPISPAVVALADLFDAIQRAEDALRGSLSALQGKGPKDFETPSGKIRGEVLKVTAAEVHLRCETLVNGVNTPYETIIKIPDLAASEVRRHAGGFKPATPAEHLAQAARALALRDAAWADAGLAAVGNHPMEGFYRPRLLDLKAKAVEAAAKDAWEAVARFAGAGKLTSQKAKAILDRIEAFEKEHGRTAYAVSIAPEILAQKDRVFTAGGGWKSVPLDGLTVRCQGKATTFAKSESLSVNVPAGQGNLATIPLFQHTRDFRMRFEYRGDLLEMFFRKVQWHGALILLAAPTGITVRTYPTDVQNQPMVLIQDKQTADKGVWHRVEISAIGSAFTLTIDAAALARDLKLPAVARGDMHILVWPGKVFELRNLSVAVLDKQAGAGTAEGIVTDKGPDWIDFKEDGEDVPLRYEPARGPGGAHDPQGLKAIQGTTTINRARITWTLDRGPLRFTALEVLKPPQLSGTIVGTITYKQGSCIEIDPASGPPERLIPRWIGGLPAQGGGPDPKMVAELAKYGVGDRVKADWTYDDRKRLMGLEAAK